MMDRNSFDGRIADLEFREGMGEYLEEKETKQRLAYEEMIVSLQEVIRDFFPEDADKFRPPSYEIFFLHWSGAIKLPEDESDDVDPLTSNSFIGLAAIRFVDNFLDETLWPLRTEYAPDVFEKLVKGFLERAFVVAQTYEPSLPREILRLPFLELELELHPTQENIDKHVVELIKNKSLDLYYLYELFESGDQKAQITLPETREYTWKAINDFSRDFSDSSRAEDTDFNLYSYYIKHRFVSNTLVDFLINTIQQDDIDTADLFREYIRVGGDVMNLIYHSETVQNHPEYLKAFQIIKCLRPLYQQDSSLSGV